MSVSLFQPHASLDINLETILVQLRQLPDGLSDRQYSYILHLIRLADKDINEYTTEISRLESQLSSLKAQCERVERQKLALHSLLSPLRSLPNEILTIIFRCACLGNNSVSCSNPGFVYTISAVCSRWCHLAIDSSELWANFRYTFYSEEMFRVRMEPVLGLYLERSKQQLLTLDIDAHEYWESQDRSNPTMQKLAEYSALATCNLSLHLFFRRAVSYPAQHKLACVGIFHDRTSDSSGN
ncbi:hypothetical protein BDP27DRAFT_816623 [Rhodocollybia butyracea]|uniref:F-box domain-containing protein n=1 Tax=Rhodocollybia butyracea TaxID=206335 RepID=A0A9P5U703_9AGAR|nr:hypothetical protein BDP27DRAFT_816623 [Rhodocollybia butyracea]